MKYEVALPAGMKWGRNNNMDRDAREELNLYSAYYLGTWMNRQLWDIDCETDIYAWLTLKFGLEAAPDIDALEELVNWDEDDE
jgi:hypothetical protein